MGNIWSMLKYRAVASMRYIWSKLTFRAVTDTTQAHSGQTSQATKPGKPTDLYSQEEKQFLRISALVLKTGTRALRSFFDYKIHPINLQTELNTKTNKDKLQKLKGRIIHAGQWNTLYPAVGGVVSSTNYDITLMSLLLREIVGINTPVTGWNVMPGGGDHSEGADIARLKLYRNEIAHNNDGAISVADFQTKSADIQQVITRLARIGGQNFEAEINRILTYSIDETDIDLWREVRLELQQMKKDIVELKEADVDRRREEKLELQELKKEIANLTSREISQGQLESWNKDDETFSPTKATEYIYKEAQTKHKILLDGLPGSGKSANVHHIALRLKDKGYKLFCMRSVNEMVEMIDKLGEDKQVYVFDDVFGVHGVVEDKRRGWGDENKDNLERCLQKPNVIILCTSRSTVIKDDQLSNIKSHFTIINISQGENELSDDERVEIFRRHAAAKQRDDLLKDENQLTDKIKNKIENITCPVGCFPLVCRLYTGDKEIKQTIEEYFNKPLKVIADNLNSLRIEEPIRHFCLLLCLIYDNKLPVNIIEVAYESEKDEQTKLLRQELLGICELPVSTSVQTIKNKMDTLLQTFVKLESDKYQFVHDIIHDAVITHVTGLPSGVHKVFMRHCSSEFMLYRVHLSGVVCKDWRGDPGHDTESCINIRPESFTCWGVRVLDMIRDGVRTSDQLYNDIDEGRCSRYDVRVFYDNPWWDVFYRNRCVRSTEGQTAIVRALKSSDVQSVMCTKGYRLPLYGDPRVTGLHWAIGQRLTHIVKQTVSMLSPTQLHELDSADRYGGGLLSWADIYDNKDIQQIVRQKLQEGQSVTKS